ncbi:MAG: hypothetical protein A2268_12545 [Candidatus Raymondbacteria bacterium RifOxyA12_full_50_37]|uniref:Uncharacterized protein n=1 Tax=Candidatus Raymondbacteria bacterium RIFOXYD12_FULL_49_13 TaxID=1817890 RepID=A0A1F7FAF9_UNCRA|nr:MAG: hypothetical protein A2268_12545 [Candidatus Raymondbacteria bacterium RifOxyA12_full_50_37]OGJ91005.1 MAG: hypothetical protein A2248_00565 [Candidatus Raymondbacteria bacterium RIFOXYA2_FULL_49_16]OGJ97442.1 MAG: hypothetical protein A2453_10115 [Candidatus Raymondbacteria bacterium RIFOXYC2_FULL_50_21]OGK01761.1 MAG: hypothetical protein A2350_17565 [Candidatus Raymondbacteria bacterium RifOxyB12_full_50_8]OGK03588.1 MAG: hypothetical protein A2519_11780 [Candidatus Raymondbacteria b
MADKLEELKNILVGDELRKFDTKFMEFGDQLKKMSESSNSSQVAEKLNTIKAESDGEIAKVNDKIVKMQKNIEAGFSKIVDTLNGQFKKLEEDLAKNKQDLQAIRDKFDGFKKLFGS